MRELLVVLFIALIIFTLYLTIKNSEQFISKSGCLPNTYKGTPLQMYENLFKGGCFIEEDENYSRSYDMLLDVSVQNPDRINYCINSLDAPPLYSFKHETKPWCYFPNNNL